tara:strand:+ start:3416 stop:4150 length:735 start_codon:yes stop_codon:yes gene_type:complete
MSIKTVLVLGSKPSSQLPDIIVDEIFSANGAAERARIYREKYKNIKLTSIVGAKEFLKNDLVKNFIIGSNPNNVIIRTGQVYGEKYFDKNCKTIHLSWSEQFKIQKIFFKYSSFSIILAELVHWNLTSRDPKFHRKILHLMRSIKNNQFWGISTGFFSILYALYKYPHSKIIVSGIGLSGGKQFYKSERSKIFDYFPRASVDRYLVKHLKSFAKSNLFSLDEDFIKNTNCSKWEGPVLKEKESC